ncbi:MAG: histone deacetylase [Pseudomonadota bacterium]
MKTRLVYSPHYDFSILGMEKLHPFDAKKFSKAWTLLQQEFGDTSKQHTTFVSAPVSDQELLAVHTEDYLKSLMHSKAIADVIEVSLLALLPSSLLRKGLVTPAKYATAGTILATRQALEGAVVFNLGGGFHHAFADHGEGFCFFADAAVALAAGRNNNLISQDDTVVMIDLDAHRGNGFTSFCENDKSVGIFDLYNMQAYPGLKDDPNDEFPFIIPLRAGLGSEEYLQILKEELPIFLNKYKTPKLAFYNAGTDIVATDKLGGLNVSYEAVIERDKFVIDQLRALNIPTVIMTSGGYSKESHKLIAELASYLLRINENI